MLWVDVGDLYVKKVSVRLLSENCFRLRVQVLFWRASSAPEQRGDYDVCGEWECSELANGFGSLACF